MDSIETTVGQTTEINLIMLFKLMCNIYIEESFVTATTYQFYTWILVNFFSSYFIINSDFQGKNFLTAQEIISFYAHVATKVSEITKYTFIVVERDFVLPRSFQLQSVPMVIAHVTSLSYLSFALSSRRKSGQKSLSPSQIKKEEIQGEKKKDQVGFFHLYDNQGTIFNSDLDTPK